MCRALWQCARLPSRAAPVVRRSGRCWHDVCSPGRLGDHAPDASLPYIVKTHAQWLHKRPIVVNAIGAGAAGATGDLLAQLASRLADESAATTPPDLLRALRLACFGGMFVGVAGELWFRALVRRLPGATYESALRAILDQADRAP